MMSVKTLMVVLQIAFFKVEVTPPIGAQMAYGVNKKIDTPIFIRGIVIDDGYSRTVIASCDFIYIWGQSWFDWRKAIADAAGTSEDRVFLHSIHQHDSMRIAPQWNEFYRKFGKEAVSEEYCRKTMEKLRQAVTAAVNGKWQGVTRLMTAENRLSGLASSRRILDENGKWIASRVSMCNDPKLNDLPVGTIDPLLRTIAFAGEDGKIIAAMHFYTTHPMAAYRREMVSQDVPGVALDYAEKEFGKGVFNMYLTGCGGDITFGKYYLGDKEKSLEVLGGKLGKGIVYNLQKADEKPMGKLSFSSAEFEIPLNPEITEEAMLKRAENGVDGNPDLGGISRLIIVRNWQKWKKCSVSRLSIGTDVHLLSLPSEVCVEYQLYAQSLVPEKFLACAAYGNGTYHYIPTAKMFSEGGYEPNSSITTPEIESRLKQAIYTVLKDIK
ncbi:MAG: hypothetical protein IT583_02545 [Verrucomicrobia bacterium]|nr:hypothetical protein [Verrucomicrobiota bacterium]